VCVLPSSDALPKLYQHFLPDEAIRHGALRTIATIAIGNRRKLSNDMTKFELGITSWEQQSLYGHQYVIGSNNGNPGAMLMRINNCVLFQSHYGLDRGTEEDGRNRFDQFALDLDENGYAHRIMQCNAHTHTPLAFYIR
jgi:hypothetical protein